eukprot:superscaffoldBa00000089_g1317
MSRRPSCYVLNTQTMADARIESIIGGIDRRGLELLLDGGESDDRKEECTGRPYLGAPGRCDGKWNVRRGKRNKHGPHVILQHQDSAGTYARILFVDFSSAFNTIIPALLQDKLYQLHISDCTCRWITNFLSDRKQHVKLGKHVLDPLTISTGSPQGCFLSPLLFSLSPRATPPVISFVKLLKFTDDTRLTGLISAREK